MGTLDVHLLWVFSTFYITEKLTSNWWKNPYIKFVNLNQDRSVCSNWEQSRYGQSSLVNGQIQEKGESRERERGGGGEDPCTTFVFPSPQFTTLPFLFYEIDKRRFVSLGITDYDTAAWNWTTLSQESH